MSDLGYSVSGPCRELLGSLTGWHALIVGNAEGCVKQAEAVRQGYALSFGAPPLMVFAVNDAATIMPRIDFMVSLHADKMPEWTKKRFEHFKRHTEFKTHTSFTALAQADFIWRIEPATFSLSGLFAAQIAYLMGCERIILCGCPGDGTKRWMDDAPRTDYQYGSGESAGDKRDRLQLVNEMNRVPEMKKRIRSMSGFTKEFFGGIDG